MTNLDSILKSRDITLPVNVHIVKAMVFPVIICGCESWTIKKAECQRIDAFQLWCWRRLLTVPWTARRSNQSSLKEINLEYLLGELMLKLQYFGHLMLRSHLIGRNPDAGKDWRQKEEVEEDEKVRLHTDSMDRNLSKLWEIVEDRGSSHAEVHGIGKNPTQLSNWTTNCLLGCRWPTSKIPQ